jgi:hypothetical protein
VPFDHEEDFHFIATAYYLSPAVRSFWEKQYAGPILWFGSTLEVIADYLEKLTAERIAAAPPAPAAAISGSRKPFAAAPGSSRPPFAGVPGASRPPFGTAPPFGDKSPLVHAAPHPPVPVAPPARS